jgi:cytochrome c-type biogenesis protein CcmE
MKNKKKRNTLVVVMMLCFGLALSLVPSSAHAEKIIYRGPNNVKVPKTTKLVNNNILKKGAAVSETAQSSRTLYNRDSNGKVVYFLYEGVIPLINIAEGPYSKTASYKGEGQVTAFRYDTSKTWTPISKMSLTIDSAN